MDSTVTQLKSEIERLGRLQIPAPVEQPVPIEQPVPFEAPETSVASTQTTVPTQVNRLETPILSSTG